MTAAARNTDMVRSAIKLATKANEVGIEAAAALIDERLKQWKASAAIKLENQRERLAEVMVRELTTLAAGIRALK